MRILVLSFYFKPDLSAGSFRNVALVNKLAEKIDENSAIDVVTSLPNRYKSFNVSASEFENSNNINIYRIKIPTHRSGFIDQIISFKTYYFQTQRLVKSQKYDIIFASSSRLFTAFLGARISRKNKIPLYLDIRDIFVDTIRSIIKKPMPKFILGKTLSILEHYTIKSAYHLNLVSKGFSDYFEYYKGNKTFFTNGIDDEFIGSINKVLPYRKNKIIIYAGNMGEGQGLEKIIPDSAEKLPDYLFKLYGDGGTRKLIEQKINERSIKNVQIFDPIGRKELIEEYNNSDYLFMHLNDYEAFKKVLPSKIFEFGATNKPILAGVGGYAAKFVSENISDSIVFEPCNANDLIKKIKQHQPENKIRTEFIEKFNRNKIMDEMATSILKLSKIKKKII